MSVRVSASPFLSVFLYCAISLVVTGCTSGPSTGGTSADHEACGDGSCVGRASGLGMASDGAGEAIASVTPRPSPAASGLDTALRYLDCGRNAVRGFQQALSRTCDKASRAFVLCYLSVAYSLDNNPEQAKTLLEQAQGMLPSPPGPEEFAVSRLAGAALLFSQNQQVAGVNAAREAADAARAGDSYALAGRALRLIGRFGPVEERKMALLQAVELAERAASPFMGAFSRFLLARLEAGKAHYDKALSCLTPVVDLVDTNISARLCYDIRMLEGRCRRKLQRQSGAVYSFRKALDVARRLDDNEARAEALEPLIIDAMLRGRLAKARALTVEGIEALESPCCALSARPTGSDYVDVCSDSILKLRKRFETICRRLKLTVPWRVDGTKDR